MKLVYNDTSHAYWLEGRRVKSASKVAGIAADSFTVEQWQKRQVAIGMTLDPTLAERVAVDLDNREAIQKVCDDAANAAKANARANRGTQRHRVFELLLLGNRKALVTDQQRNDAKVLERTLDAYGLEPIRDRVEQFVAWPEHGVVGRYDAYLRHQGRPVLTDLKGGVNAVKYPHSTAVQEWLYRFAPFTSKTINRDGDRSEVTEWTSQPDDADEDVGYVIYCDDHHDVGELWRIDLTAARRGGELALGIVDWRKTKSYGKELAVPVSSADAGSREAPEPTSSNSSDGVLPSAEESIAALAIPPAGQPASEAAASEASLAAPAPAVEQPAGEARTAASPAPLVEQGSQPAAAARCAPGAAAPGAITDDEARAEYAALDDETKRMVMNAALAHMRSEPGVTKAEAVKFALGWHRPFDVEIRYEPAAAPAPLPERALRFTGDEGPDVTEAAASEARGWLQTLGDDYAAVHAVAREAAELGLSFHIVAKPSRRRWEIYRGLACCARFGWNEHDVRELLAAASGDNACLQPAVELGRIVGLLDVAQATAFADMAAALASEPMRVAS